MIPARPTTPLAKPPFAAWKLTPDNCAWEAWGVRSSTGVNVLGAALGGACVVETRAEAEAVADAWNAA